MGDRRGILLPSREDSVYFPGISGRRLACNRETFSIAEVLSGSIAQHFTYGTVVLSDRSGDMPVEFKLQHSGSRRRGFGCTLR